MKKIYTLIFTITILCSAKTVLAQWVQTKGPKGITVKKFFDNDSVLFAGTSAKGVFKSKDHGLTWIPLNTGIENQEVFSLERDSLYIYAGTEQGVYRSADNGATWTAANTGIQTQFINYLLLAGGYLFAGSYGTGVYRSPDHGNTWVDANGGTLTAATITGMCYSGGKIFAEDYSYLYYSTDWGSTWNQDMGTTQFYPVENFYTIGDTIFASAYGGVFYSYDGGNNWSSYLLIDPLFKLNGFALSHDTLYAGGQGGMYRSVNYGASWTFIPNTGLQPGFIFHNHFVKSGANYLLGLDEHGVLLTADNGATWNQSVSGFTPASTIDNSMITIGSDLITGTHSDGVYKTPDNGVTWNKIGTANPLDTLSNSIVFSLLNPAPSIILAGACDFGIYRSADNGVTWSFISSGLPQPLCVNSLAKSGNNILAATDQGLYYSSNNGLSWSSSNIPSNYNVECVAAIGNVACAGVVAGISANSGIYRSTNNGVSFTLQANLLDAVCMAADGGNYFYYGTFGGCAYSPDNGISWFAVGGGFPPSDPGFCILAIGSNVFIGNNNGVYFSSNHAASFVSVNQGFDPYPNNSVQGLAANSNFIFAGMFIDAVWRRPLSDFGITGVAENQNFNKEDLILYPVYPNPFSNKASINYSLPQSGDVALTISDIEGRKVYKSETKSESPGEHSILIDGKNFSSGIYFVQLNWNGNVKVMKMEVGK
jgi:photosystem II stability/assembly factor-like uncharacterized protein